MLTQNWLTDAVLYTYALSLLFFVSGAAAGNRSARKMGTGLLVFVWVIQTTILLYILIQSLTDPQLTIREFLLYVSWLLVSASFLLNRLMNAELLVLLVNVAGFSVLTLNLIQRPGHQIAFAADEAGRKLLVVHISFISLAFVVLTIAALLLGMYLFLHRMLKTKRWTHLLSRMPSLEVIEQYAYRSSLIGIPLLLLAISTGTAALLLTNDAMVLLDLKVLLAFMAGACYIIYLIRKKHSEDEGTKLAKWQLAGYVLLIADFFASTYSSFHRWF